ncbi:MAG: retention module-containing protein, partial [Oleibacter sp.]|nr:retention module-containing protein [Thalassolituus sp.]
MANVGTVQSVTGVVRAIAEDGTERILSVGDTVAENEKIITGDGVIVIAFTDGTVMDMGSNSSLVLNDDVLNQEGEQTAQSRESAGEEVAALQEALTNPNFDPTADLPATAAGPAAAGGAPGNNGHSVVSVDYLNPEAPVEAGFDTVGISQEFLQPDEELPPVIDSPPEADDVLTEGSRGDELPAELQSALSQLGLGGSENGNWLQNGTNGSAVQNTLTVSAGDEISFDWFFDADDYQPFNDFSFAVIDGVAFELADISDVGSYNTAGWTTFTYKSTSSGDVSIGFGTMNTGDSGVTSYLLVDNLQVNGSLVEGFNVDLSEWNTLGTVSLVPSHDEGGTPTEGGSLLQLNSSGSGNTTSISSLLDISAGDLSNMAASYNGGAPDITFYKQLTVDGIIGDSDFVVADFGGSDVETSLENLVFTLNSSPTYGSLILVAEGGIASELFVGDTFTSADTVWWYVTEEEYEAFEDDAPQAVLFNYSVTDEEGQTGDATVTILTPNSNPVAGESFIAVDEDGLTNGIAGGDGDLVIPNDDGDDNESTAAGQLNYSFGLDGAGDVDFASLDGSIVQATGGSGLQDLTSEGYAITYKWNAETHTLTGIADEGGADEYVVFELVITDLATGDYTFTLLAKVDHPTANTENDFVLDLPFVVTDSDGDSAGGSLSVTIDDDLPTVDVGRAMTDDVVPVPTAIPTLTTQDAETDGDPTGTDTDSADFSGLFTLTQGMGADDSGTAASLSYALSVTNAASGLTSEGLAITLSLTEDGVIEGHDSNDLLIFSVSVDGSGSVTLSQHEEIDHLPEDVDGVNDNSNIGLPSGTIALTASATIVDGDNDDASDSEAVDISTAISFDDDLPTVTIGQSSDSASEFTVENHDEVSSAGFHNSYGYYVKTLDPNGDVISNNPTTGVVIEDDVHFEDGGFTLPITVTGYSQEQIGYFIIPNGDRHNPTLADGDQVYFNFVGGQWQAFSDEGFTSPIFGAGSHVLFDAAALNKDGQDHMVDNGLIGNQN